MLGQQDMIFILKESSGTIPGATVGMDSANWQISDVNGRVLFKNVSPAKHVFSFSMMGYRAINISLDMRSSIASPMEIDMMPEDAELEEVTVSSTRTNSRIEELPVKVEVLGEEEMQEENVIKPGNVASLLGDISVIHIQQTSSTTGNSVVRMQGLDGRYTQILRDGLPAYDGLSGSFGILQIPPLDLKQIEIIKGSTSTLYGAGAISGMINMISKTPGDSTEAAFTINGSTLLEGNFNAYFSKRGPHAGLTFFAGTTQQAWRDVNKDGYSDVPLIQQAVWHPRLFLYLSKKANLVVGYNGLVEKRAGGDTYALKYKATNDHPYLDEQHTLRNSADILFDVAFNEKNSLQFKALGLALDRKVMQTSQLYHAANYRIFTELNEQWKTKKNTLVTGLNYSANFLQPQQSDSSLITKSQVHTFGAFAQDDYQITHFITVEGGARLDYNRFGAFFLPRLSFLFKPIQDLQIRISGGSGYKTPDIFSYSDLGLENRYISSSTSNVRAEVSYGGNADIAYKAKIGGKAILQLDQAFYYAYIQHPIFLSLQNNGILSMANADYYIDSRGTDTYIRLSVEEFEMYLGYNHTIAKQRGSTSAFVPFSPQDKFAATAAYTIPHKWRFGVECSWVGNQYGPAQHKLPSYWFLAAMVEKKFTDKISLVLNGENLLDARQSRFEPIVIGPTSNPTFKQLYAPIDGWVLNMSLHVKL